MGGGGDNCHRPGDRCCLMKPCARRGFAPASGADRSRNTTRGVESGGSMYGTFTRRSLFAGWVLAAVVAACAPKDGIIGPPSGLIYGISDAAHGGTPGFYFLPPMTLQPAFSGTFDADITTLDPRVAICDVTISYDVDCGGSSAGATPAVVVFTTTTTPAITLDLATPQYQVSWDTHCPGCLAGHVYRVHVTAGAAGTRRELGYADVFLTGSSGTVKLTGDLIVRQAGRTLPIHFRIETAIPAGLAVSAATPDVLTGHTDPITATVRDLHGTALAGVTVAWSLTTTPATDVAALDVTSGQTGTDGTTVTTLTAGATPGTALVTATSTGLSVSVSIDVRAAARPLYVANQVGNTITVYGPGASGDAAPTATIGGNSTGLNAPWGVALDAVGKVYVANANGNSVTVYAAGANGDATPVATIFGGTTGLSFPTAVAVDASGRLYVANGVANSITVYAAGANGDATPVATILGGTTGLSFPVAITLDAAGNLYVANSSGNSITMYAAGANGDVAPAATLAGGNTGLDFPWGIAVDGTGQLHVANANVNTITIYAAGASGDVAPTATIVGNSTGLNQPFGITF